MFTARFSIDRVDICFIENKKREFFLEFFPGIWIWKLRINRVNLSRRIEPVEKLRDEIPPRLINIKRHERVVNYFEQQR